MNKDESGKLSCFPHRFITSCGKQISDPGRKRHAKYRNSRPVLRRYNVNYEIERSHFILHLTSGGRQPDNAGAAPARVYEKHIQQIYIFC